VRAARPSLRVGFAFAATVLSFATAFAAEPRKSGIDFASAATRALQADDTQNPAMLWVKDGQALWAQRVGATGKACVDCHGEISKMRGVAGRYPAVAASPATSTPRVLNLSQQINRCRVEQQQASAWPAESGSLLGLEAALAFESRNLPIAPPAQPVLAAAQARGEALYNQRIGQMDLSCRDCHDRLAGKRLGGNTIPQGHPTGYPIYRLEWQAVGSLQRRIRGCMTAVRAEPYAWNASELLDLEAWLARRAAGMVIESPGVRP